MNDPVIQSSPEPANSADAPPDSRARSRAEAQRGGAPDAVSTAQTAGLSPEARVLLASAGGPERDREIRMLLDGGVDWQRLLAISLREGAQPVLGRRVRALAGDEIPDEIAADMRQVERTGEFRQRYLERRLRDALDALSAAGVRVLLLKGAALAFRLFGDFSRRPMSDVDLLVANDQADLARRALLDAGWTRRFGEEYDEWYRGMHHLPPMVDARTPGLQIGLEIHTDLLPQERNPFRFSAADLWSEFTPLEGLPSGIGTSSLEMHLLHCAVHHAWSHRLAGAAWRSFRDTTAIAAVPRFGWRHFLERATNAGARAPCYWSLTLARQLSGASVPDEVISALRPRLRDSSIRWMLRHFAHEAVETERVCPSDRLRTVIWRRAMGGGTAVRRAARSDRRPWRRLRDPDAGPGSPPLWSREALRPSAWMAFLRGVTG